ncbi:major facilitator superfamily domain-containing protein [Absidia repens]|uniref:Lysosomal dipeptide transporter MFSD1 n=1 Tax=Absidia repens TaxID=90262 RepID=A0A1X2IAZ5_9FUNG|nr:major facilitator superfamily domain-containing protein [Absidia repens]
MASNKKALDTVELHDKEEIDNHGDRLAHSSEDTSFIHSHWRFKAIALLTALLLSAGGHFSASAISAMKSTVKSQLHIDNTKYGVLSSSVSIINTLIPIAGGTFVDTFGAIWGTLAANFMIVLGSILTAMAAKFHSFTVMIIGRIVFGIGSGVIVTMQESILSKWFRTRQLALVIGIQFSVGRLAAFMGTLVSNPIVEATGDWVWTFWLGLIFCAFSAAMNVIYACVVKYIDRQHATTNTSTTTTTTTINEPEQRKRLFYWRSILKFPLIYWLIILIECIHAAVWTSFHTIATEFVRVRFHTTDVEAGYTSSVAQIVPVVVTPFLGVLMDRVGGRMLILLLSSIFLVLSAALLGWTWADAAIGMVCYSMSLAMGPITMITSIGMILPPSYIGTGLGIYKSSNNIGATIMDIVVGIVQDKTAHQAYTGVMLSFLVLSAIGGGFVALLWVSQRCWHNDLLNCRKSVRLVRMKLISEREQDLATQGLDHYSNTPFTFISCMCVVAFMATLLVAWVLFFVYAVSGRTKA